MTPGNDAGAGRHSPDRYNFTFLGRTSISTVSRVWKPSVTVAAVVERDGRFLLVEEHTEDGLRINQPAGHLDPGESLLQAVAREALEETAHPFTPTALLGIYLWRRPGTANGTAYLRFAFTGELGERIEG